MKKSLIGKITSPEITIPAIALFSLANVISCVETQKKVEHLQPFVDVKQIESSQLSYIKNIDKNTFNEDYSFLKKISNKGKKTLYYGFHYALWPGRQFGYFPKVKKIPNAQRNNNFQTPRNSRNNRLFQ